MPPLKIIFMGTAELACASLEALALQPDFAVVAVVTQPDKPRGRDMKLQPGPVKTAALKRQLNVVQPERARNPEFIRELMGFKPDLIVVAAYGQILPQAILDIPPLGCVNVHTSLLPKYRGAAPIQWAILNGDSETGVTIMKMDAGLDTGGILAQKSTPIAAEDNSQTLHDRLAQIGAELLVTTIRQLAAGSITPRPQPAEGSSYARKITKEDGKLDWTHPARVLWNRVRGFTPWPGAYTHVAHGAAPQLLKVWQAEVAAESGKAGCVIEAGKNGIVVACGAESLRLTQVQREGGRRMTAAEYLAGHPLKPGDVLG
jgi:methionyl-tRNA formyltransferase